MTCNAITSIRNYCAMEYEVSFLLAIADCSVLTFYHVNIRVMNINNHLMRCSIVLHFLFSPLRSLSLSRTSMEHEKNEPQTTVLNLCIFPIHSPPFTYSCAIKYFVCIILLLCEKQQLKAKSFRKRFAFCLHPACMMQKLSRNENFPRMIFFFCFSGH